MSLIEIEGFSYSYPGEALPTLQDVNLRIEPGAFVVITGKSGSGKSTLGKALAGFLFQDEQPEFTGKILVNGADMTQLPIYEACEYVAYVQQNPEDQFCTLTVKDEIAFGLENFCMEPGQIELAIDRVLEIVQGQSLKDRNLASLSGGEKQKIAIASLLVLHPNVLILDEPTSNLDPIATKHIFETLSHIRKNRELTVIIIEHKLSQLLPLATNFYEIDHGKIESQSMDKITSQELLYQKEGFSPLVEEEKLRKPNIVELSDVVVDIDGKRILDQVDLNLKPGDFVALMGPNGSGKSTLLETIMGFHPLQSGTCRIFKNPQVMNHTSDLVKKMGVIFQNPDHQLFTQSVWDEATFTSKNIGVLDEEKVEQGKNWLLRAGLAERLDDHPQRLSYGEKRRLNLISAMLHAPKLMLIDELLIGQDLFNAKTWMTALNDYTKRGGTVLLVNHHPDLTQAYCDRILFMENGRIIVDQSMPNAFREIAALGYSPFLPSLSKESVYA